MTPTRTTSLLAPLMLRSDLSRDAATTYWAKTHADKVIRLPHLLEYNQRLFSSTDHGFWPATAGIGTSIPRTWHLDGCAEIRFTSAAAMLRTGLHSREVFLDEQNVFTRVLAHHTGPRGGRWFTDGYDNSAQQHVALLLRRRMGVAARMFRSFVHQQLSPALMAAGARDLRSYAFLPYTPLLGGSPGVAHDNPPQHRYHAAVFFGVDDRAALDELLTHDNLAEVLDTQHTVLTAVHGYAVERTVPVIGRSRTTSFNLIEGTTP
ncbi:hypothetical protein MTY66_38020 [Mycolicibacterium sp. TY66]|nr:hypothetical protein MTY66_38020 [Mycolicibacterium sp. TY66]BCJ80178.1 hypothetical protein MTY81_15510 [Mycolicibacterium sp. TY81]